MSWRANVSLTSLRRYLTLILLLSSLTLMNSCSPSSAPRSLDSQKTAERNGNALPAEKIVLPNGLTIVTLEDHSAPVSSVQVWAKTGSIHEANQMGAGLSHILEHMLFKGTEKR